MQNKPFFFCLETRVPKRGGKFPKNPVFFGCRPIVFNLHVTIFLFLSIERWTWYRRRFIISHIWPPSAFNFHPIITLYQFSKWNLPALKNLRKQSDLFRCPVLRCNGQKCQNIISNQFTLHFNMPVEKFASLLSTSISTKCYQLKV